MRGERRGGETVWRGQISSLQCHHGASMRVFHYLSTLKSNLPLFTVPLHFVAMQAPPSARARLLTLPVAEALSSGLSCSPLYLLCA